MKNLNLLLMAVLFMCAAVVTSCSNDVVSNDVDGALPTTKSVSGAYLVKNLNVTVGVNTSPTVFTYDENNKLSTISVTRISTTKVYEVVERSASQVVIKGYDSDLEDTVKYTYTLNANGYVTEAKEEDSAFTYSKMQFTYDGRNRLASIQYGEEVDDDVWEFETLNSFTYVSNLNNNFKYITEEGVEATCAREDNLLNKASIDLNLYCMFGMGNAYGEIFNFAVYADLFPNTQYLVTSMNMDENNYVTYTYTMSGDKAMSCSVSATSEDLDEDDNPVSVTTALSSVTFGY